MKAISLWSIAFWACLAVVSGTLANVPSGPLPRMPDCAAKCLSEAVADSDCSLTDQACQCANRRLKMEFRRCAVKSCSIKESLTTKNLTMTACHAPIRDRSEEHLTMSNIIGTIAGTCVIQRLFFKAWWKLGFGLDDLFIFLSAVSGIASLALNHYGVADNGLGRDIWTVPFEDITEFGKYFYLMAIIYFAQITLLKMALLFFYLRIFPTRNVRLLLWGTVIFNSVFGFVFVIVAIFQCRPISYFWQKWDGEHEGSCENVNAIAWSNAAISIALDIWMLAIPMCQLRGLNLDWKKKVWVGLMFFVGTFVTVVSIIRLRYLLKFGLGNNPTWDYLKVSKWSIIEIAVGEICACMPSLRVLLVRLSSNILNLVTRRKRDESEKLEMSSQATIGRVTARTDSVAHTLPHRADDEFDCERRAAASSSHSDESQLFRCHDPEETSVKFI